MSNLPEQRDDLVGETLLGKVRVLRKIGEGAHGTVYEVLHTLTQHHRALKVLRGERARSGEAVARLVREASVAGRVQSPFVVETFDVGRLDDGSPYILMELLRGRSVRSLIEEQGRLEAGQAVELVAQACEGLSAVHGAGIVHRDIKPDNLFVVDDARGRRQVKLLDFGVLSFARGGDDLGTLTEGPNEPGSPAYMAPEQLDGEHEADERTDVYALGVTLYEMLCGHRPFEAATMAQLVLRVHRGTHVPLRERVPSIDGRLARVVERAMHRDREQRFASVSALREALSTHLPFDAARSAEGLDVGPRSSRQSRSSLGPLAAAAVALIAGAFFLRAQLASPSAEATSSHSNLTQGAAPPPSPPPTTPSSPETAAPAAAAKGEAQPSSRGADTAPSADKPRAAPSADRAEQGESKAPAVKAAAQPATGRPTTNQATTNQTTTNQAPPKAPAARAGLADTVF